MRNIDNILKKFREVVDRHYLGDGAYSNWIFQNDDNSRDMGINPYGCADAMNILYMLNEFPAGDEREAAKKALQSLQNPENGLFEEPSHHFIHTTAHCIAALDLFDANPLCPQKEMLSTMIETCEHAILVTVSPILGDQMRTGYDIFNTVDYYENFVEGSREVAKEMNIPVADANAEFKKILSGLSEGEMRNVMFCDDWHVNSKGHKIYAEKIVEKIDVLL